MIELGLPLAFILLPLPFLIRAIFPMAKKNHSSPLVVPFFYEAQNLKSNNFSHKIQNFNWLKAFAIFAWLFLVVAASKPRWVGEPVPVEVSGRELMLAIDVSGSMQVQDFRIGNVAVNRMLVVKNAASNFIANRCGDKLGLIFFGTRAYLVSPPTFDCDAVKTMMDDIEIGIAGTNTAIGDAIAMAVKYTQDRKDGNNVLILLTDGANNSGNVSPEEAIKLAAMKNLKIYTIGVGSNAPPTQLFMGMVMGGAADFDEESLKQIAATTGGRYFHAKDTKGLEQIYMEIDKLEPISKDERLLKPVKELFYIPLAISMFFSFLIFVFLSFVLSPKTKESSNVK